jgi:hypothetical protein
VHKPAKAQEHFQGRVAEQGQKQNLFERKFWGQQQAREPDRFAAKKYSVGDAE